MTAALAFTDEEELEYLQLLDQEVADLTLRAWLTGDLRYKLHPVQRMIHATIRGLPQEQRDAVILCARRFGKSFLVVCMAIEDCIQNPGCIVRVVGPEIEQTIEIIEFNLDKIVRDAPGGIVRRQGSRRRWAVGESHIMVGAFDAKNVKKNLGKEALNIYTEEAGASNSETFDYGMREVLSPQLLHTKGRMVHATTPPPELDHIFATQYIPQASRDGSLFKFRIWDNPRLDEAQIQQAIDDSRGRHTIAFRRNYECELVKDPGVVCVPSFTPEVHVRGDWQDPAHAIWFMFGDWGGIRDQSWIGVAYYDFERATLRVVGETWHEPNTAMDLIAPEVLRLFRMVPKERRSGLDFALDAPGQVFIDLNKMLEAAQTDLRCRPVTNKEDLETAVNAVEVALSQNRISLDPACKQLALTCEYGRFNKQRTDFNRTPQFGHNDALAGLMYGWRACDKTTNPFPKNTYNRDNWFDPEANAQANQEPIFRRF